MAFLTLDIETMGLMHHLPLPPITCACLYDGTTKYELLFYKIEEDEYNKNAAELLRLLDSAERLAGFNAVRFDLPYIAQQLQVTKQRLEGWVAKCIDPYIGMVTALKQTSKLQRLLDLNHMGSKTGTGSDAIVLARAGKMRELLDYCMMDVLLTHELCLMSIDKIRTGETTGLKLLTSTWTWEAVRFEPEKVPTMEEALLLTSENNAAESGMGGSDDVEYASDDAE